MKYTEFVKANYHKVANLPAKQRMAKLGQMWRASGHSSGKGVVGGSEGGMFIKRKGGKGGKRGKKQVRGKGLFNLGSILGLGVPEGGDVAGGADEKGSGIISDALGAFGLGMPEGGDVAGGKMRKVKGKGLFNLGSILGLGMPEGGDVAGGKMRKVRGKGIISDALGAFGLGMPEGKGVVGGADEKGAGILSGMLGAIGLGMPNNIKHKHYKRMVTLEKELHEKGKLSPVKHNKLKVYHTLHGAGFFDSLWSGIKKGASTVVSVIPAAINTVGQVAKIIPEAAKFVPAFGKLAAPLAKVAPLAAML
jgi:hypothetical protein